MGEEQGIWLTNGAFELFLGVITHLPVGVHLYRIEPDGRLVFEGANPAADRILGVDNRQFVGKTIVEAFPPLAATEVPERYRRAAADGVSWQTEQITYKDNQISGAFLVQAFQTGPNRMAATFLDITARKRVEEEQRLNEARFASLYRIAQQRVESEQEFLDFALHEAITLTGSRYGYLYFYDESKREFTLNTWSRDVMEACAVREPKICYELARTGIWGEAVRQRRPILLNDFAAEHPLKKGYPAGHVRLERFLTVPVFWEEKIVAVVGVANKQLDYTDQDILQLNLLVDGVWKSLERHRAEEKRRHLEHQLLHAQKLESLGVLAGGIAHDFNNILMSVIGNAGLARLRVVPESPVAENLRQIELAAGRAADLARQMLAYSGRGKFTAETTDLNRLVEEMDQMLRVSMSKKAVLSFRPARPLPAVDVDQTQIRQVVMNLVINASEAIGESSGVIAVTTGSLHCSREYLKELRVDEQLPEGLYVTLEVADTGCGMDRETVARIFDPFFTTKFTGRGLGMAAVLGIVRGHKGAIKVYSEPGKGTTFKIFLPASAGEAETHPGSVAREAWSGQGLALLVDDEESVRAVGAEMLRELGYEVITAADGHEALERYRERRPDLVVLDLTMPRLDGEQTFRELRARDPEARVVMSSGYNEMEISQRFSGKGLAGFVQKPYTLETLKNALRLALG